MFSEKNILKIGQKILDFFDNRCGTFPLLKDYHRPRAGLQVYEKKTMAHIFPEQHDLFQA